MPSSPFVWHILGRNLTAMYGTALLYFVALLAADALRGDPHVRAGLAAAWRRAAAALLAPPLRALGALGGGRLGRWAEGAAASLQVRTRLGLACGLHAGGNPQSRPA